MDKRSIRSYQIKVMGIVQGVGYRPYVYNQAHHWEIKGWVSNEGSALTMQVEGTRTNLRAFLTAVIKQPPKLTRIEKVRIKKGIWNNYCDFSIRRSSIGEEDGKFIATDVATCPECLQEIEDVSNVRGNYAFTNCTNCGPRYSIIKSLPYDRINTTMSSFEMCPECSREYQDPTHRRFHAQPNCCPKCGPSLQLLGANGQIIQSENIIEQTRDYIKQGKILAIKGLGGFHLCCDAQNERVVSKLRALKKRPDKPLAIMVKDIHHARAVCHIGKEEEEIISSNKRPIMLLGKKKSCTLAKSVAPNINRLGVMLPYTPLHYLLFGQDLNFLVMTSANISGEPIVYQNDDAIESLKHIVDFYVIHNRQIHVSVEDSVVKLINGGQQMIRNGRGYAPMTRKIQSQDHILAVGSEQKNTISLCARGYSYTSQYLGDLKHYEAYGQYQKVIEHLQELTKIKPQIIAHDYDLRAMPSKYAQLNEGEKIMVQHHHAHMVSCMVEHNLYDSAIGVVFDGTGLGDDGSIWGGEFFVATRERYVRVGHLEQVVIQGGDRAIKEIWRIGVSYLYAIGSNTGVEMGGVGDEEVDWVRQALEKNLNCFKTSSVGRLFDGVTSLIDLRQQITYDAQGAIELEGMIDPYCRESYEVVIVRKDGVYQIEYSGMMLGILKDLKLNLSKAYISTKFHNWLIKATTEMIDKISEEKKVKTVVLSGGVFQNDYLLKGVVEGLEGKGLSIYHNSQIPINDSGISIGQLAVAEAIKKEGVGCV